MNVYTATKKVMWREGGTLHILKKGQSGRVPDEAAERNARYLVLKETGASDPVLPSQSFVHKDTSMHRDETSKTVVAKEEAETRTNTIERRDIDNMTVKQLMNYMQELTGSRSWHGGNKKALQKHVRKLEDDAIRNQ